MLMQLETLRVTRRADGSHGQGRRLTKICRGRGDRSEPRHEGTALRARRRMPGRARKGIPIKKPNAQWIKPGLVGHISFLKGEGGLRHATLTDVRED
ncbi:hypothetical protein EOA75_00835 [Mesorhizobium sp. M1A.F.Ca.IN.022.07.1.1]|nr:MULTISPECIES: hypothetical protein [Mesorhizobium]RUV96741.1 hypothetical protein EOA88_02235 [Mesorhizobium sp. M5C.F.Ca.IN.020.14.1.1]RVC47138.1 hypothetical protein EN781_02455 [Mesorhizobium sp. M4A.F.Ca.ET.090.04.2.1]AZO50231.1 hypothetical protein EJ073_22355 [Mesorhizobium sp. M4B.F.Ca.ET.058.02.1.1]MCF6100591.1 hypothetical protein [Mesorhizobium muleiense]RUV31760.1 hypothetical protein EOA86_05260 [Mesorhizobium sp. M5C.F.Ca.IN.020.32.2.1]